MRVTPYRIAAAAFAASIASLAAAQAPIPVDRSGYSIFDASQIGISAILLQDFTGRSGSEDIILGTIYSSLGSDGAFGFSSQVTGPSALIDDYQGNGALGGGPLELREVSFVGGVTRAADIVFFDFFSSGGALLGGFGVAMPNTLNAVWTFNITGLGVLAANSGFMQISGDDGTFNQSNAATQLRWFETNEAVEIGANAGPTMFAFALTGIPSPGVLATFGFAGCALARRRR